MMDDSFCREYFSRQTRIASFGEAGQKRLRESSAALVGLGGLGSPAVRALAGAGVGAIQLIDSDRVEISNLHRQHLYSPEHAGEFKAGAAHRILSKQFPLTRFSFFNERITARNIHRRLESADLILDCSDNFETKYLIHDYAFLQSKNLVQGAVYQNEGTLYSFSFKLTRDSGCFRCLWPKTPAADCVGHCGEVGVLSTLAGMMGSIQAGEAVNLLLGTPGLKMGQGMFLDALSWDMRKISWPRNPACPLCSPAGPGFAGWYESKLESLLKSPQKTPEAQDFDARSGDVPVLFDIPRQPQNMRWVDIRENAEIQDGDWRLFPGVIHIPLSAKADYHGLISEGKPVVLICESGVRSLRLARRLRAREAVEVWSLEGGFSKYRNRGAVQSGMESEMQGAVQSGTESGMESEEQREEPREKEPAQV